jgi:hypothetical protein
MRLKRIVQIVVLLALAVRAARASEPGSPAAPAPAGQRVFVCGHSFHVGIAKPLEQVAKAAGIEGHATVGVQFLGGSSVTRHWELPADKNQAKQAVISGKIDVLTLSPAWLMPDPAIERFIDLAVAHNPAVRVTVQQSWVGWDALDPSRRIQQNEQRDKKTVADLKPDLDVVRTKIGGQVRTSNEKHGRRVAALVPTGDAVMLLREKVLEGKAPGIAKQSELFGDNLGHGKEPVVVLNAYCHFAVIYGRSPVGLKAFERPRDEHWTKLNRLLQELAWQAVCAEPLSGVKAGEKITRDRP